MFFSASIACAQGGTTGPLTWSLKNGTLTISGEGEIPDYGSSYGVPWHKYQESIKTVVLEAGVTRIGAWAFSYCINLTSVTIPNSITSIGRLAFDFCQSLTSINIPNSVTSIGSYAFAFCENLTSINIPNGVTSVEEGTFRDCENLTSINIPKSVTSIGRIAFYFCKSLTSIIIPDGVTNIEEGAFAYCFSLTSLTIPKSVTNIEGAFSWCSLTSIINLNSVPIAISSYMFYPMDHSTCTLKVPTEAVSAYQNAEVWKEFNIIGGDCYVQVGVNNNGYGYAIGNELYPVNTTAAVSAIAFSGYKFANWAINGVILSTKNPYIFLVTEDVEVVANFENEVGIVETRHATSLQVYPNPTAGKLRIENSELIINNVRIFDIYGRNVETHALSLQNGETITIDISHLPSGIYFAKIHTEAGEIVRKIVKE